MTGAPERLVRKFSPGTLQPDEEVKEQFVVRNHELRVLLDILRGNIESPSCQHALIVAPRGLGKTMLLARATAEIRTNPDLARHLLPVGFTEESQEIFNLTDFWLETLFHLSRECASHDSLLAEELRERHAALSERWREQTLEDHARAAVLEAADRLGRRLVLMVENLQALLKDVDPDFGWKLREVLQTEPQIILLASATRRFAELDDAEQPFFETFRIVNLKPLNTDECRRLCEVVSGDRATRREIRPLEILTGGSPRLLVIVAGFGRHRPLRRLMEELVMLIDDQAGYFRGHLDVLGKSERRVYLAVLDLWQQSTPGEIAARSRMDVRVVSTMLGRLLDRGALVFEGSSRKRRYAAAEPLYCIYYKLRRGRGEAVIVENLIRFMSVFYSEAEKAEMFSALISEGTASPALRRGLDRPAAALPDFAMFLSETRRPGIVHDRPVFLDPDSGTPAGLGLDGHSAARDCNSIKRLFKEISAASDQEAFETVIDIVNGATAIQSPAPHRMSQAFSAWGLNMKGDAHSQLGDWNSALSAYDLVLERFGNDGNFLPMGLIARALVRSGSVCEELGDPGSALSTYEEAVRRFGAEDDPSLQRWVAGALAHKGHTLREMGDLPSALSAYGEVSARFLGNERQEPQRRVAEALLWRGHVQERLQRPDSALAAYEDVAKRFGFSEDTELKRAVAASLQFKGDCLLGLGNLDSALSAYQDIVDRFTDEVDMELQRNVARAMTACGYVRRDLGETALTLAACQELMDRFGSSGDPGVDRWIAESLRLKGSILRASGEPGAALSTYDEIAERFDEYSDVDPQRWVAKALTSKAELQTELADMASAASTYGKIIRRLDASASAELAGYAAAALNRKGNAFLEQGNAESAIEAFDEFLDRFGAFEDPRLQECIAKTLLDKGRALRQMDQVELAVSAYRQTVQRFRASEDANVLWWVCGALALMARALRESGKLDAALAACGETVMRFGTSDLPRLRQWAALAAIEKTGILLEAGRPEDALRTCNEFESRLRNLADDMEHQLRWRSRQVWTRALLARRDVPAAMTMFRSLYDAFVLNDDTMMRDALEFIPELIAAGASAQEFLDILSSDAAKADALSPAVVALRQHAGDIVREPNEVLQVAADVRKRIQETRQRNAEHAGRVV